MATSQFTATSFRSFRSDVGYSTFYTGIYDIVTQSFDKFRHSYRGIAFFNASAIAAAMVNKAVDKVEIRLTPINLTRYSTSAEWWFWRTNITSMPSDATNFLGGLDTDQIGTQMLQRLTKATFTKAGGTQTGVIATGATAQAVVDSLAAGCALGLLNWVQDGIIVTTGEGDNGAIQHGGTTTAPIIIITYHDATSACLPPTSANLGASVSEGEVPCTFSGATAGTSNAITGYEFEFQESSDGSNWPATWTTLKTITLAATGGSTALALSGTRGRYRRYHMRTRGAAGSDFYSDWKIITGVVRKNSLPGEPGSLRFDIVDEGYFYNSLQCLWDNGGDPDSNFSGVHIRLARYNHDSGAGAVGWAWLDADWVWLGNVASKSYTRAQLIAKGAKAGDKLAFGIVSQDALGAQNWDAAGMTASGYVYLAADPSAPSSFTASPSIQESGVNQIWSGANGGGIAISGYDIECKVASTAAGVDGTDGYTTADGSPVATSGTSGSKTDLSDITRGYFERWRIRTITAEGTKSAWKYSNTIQKNRVPITPAVLFPVAGRTTYNTQPYVVLSIGAEPDGQTQTLYYKIDDGIAQSAGAVMSGTKKMRMPATVGDHTIQFWLQDSLGTESGEAAVIITIADNTYERVIAGYVSPSQPGTLLWDETNEFRTSEEILELKSRVNQVRAYYGLSAINLPYEATTGANSIKHFHTWMPNMSALKQGLQDTCAISGATVPTWVTRARNAPSAGVVNQIRDTIGAL